MDELESPASAVVLADPFLLHAILSRLQPDELLATVPLVCRAWREAALWCWQTIEIDGLLLGPRYPAATAAAVFWSQLAVWLRGRRGVRALKLQNLRHLLKELGEEQRRRAVAGVAAALAPAASLSRLELGRSSVALAPGTLASLAALSSLRCLALHTAAPMDAAELDAVGAGLPLLEELSVVLMRRRGHVCAFRGPFPARLCTLRRLRRLRLEAPYAALHGPHCALPDAVAEWGPQMRELHLINLGLSALPPAIGCLTALEQLCLARNRLGARHDSIPADLARLTALRRLELQYNGFSAGPPEVVGELAALEELNLSGNLWGSSLADLPRPYSQLSRLKYLTLTNCELAGLPPVVRGMSGLLLLKLNINRIETLPYGPYLRNLECLDLAHNRFYRGYPRALAAAARLHLISFQCCGVYYSDPAIALRDALAPEEPDEAPAPGGAAVAAATVEE